MARSSPPIGHRQRCSADREGTGVVLHGLQHARADIVNRHVDQQLEGERPSAVVWLWFDSSQANFVLCTLNVFRYNTIINRLRESYAALNGRLCQRKRVVRIPEYYGNMSVP